MTQSEYHQKVFETKFGWFCEKWAALLNLKGWDICYQMTEIIDGNADIQAQVRVNKELGHRATMTFASRMGFESDVVREDLVVHEHLHLILDEIGQFVYQHLPEEHHDYFTRLVEIATSDLARVLVNMKGEKGETESEGGSKKTGTAVEPAGDRGQTAGGAVD